MVICDTDIPYQSTNILNGLSIKQCFSYGFCSFEEGCFLTFSQRSHSRLYLAVVVILKKVLKYQMTTQLIMLTAKYHLFYTNVMEDANNINSRHVA